VFKVNFWAPTTLQLTVVLDAITWIKLLATQTGSVG
jgi:hypothetical protein